MSLLGFPEEDYGMTEHIQKVKEEKEKSNKNDIMKNLEDFNNFEGNQNKAIIRGNLKIIEEKKSEIVDVFGDRITKPNYNNIRNNNIIPGENGFWI